MHGIIYRFIEPMAIKILLSSESLKIPQNGTLF